MNEPKLIGLMTAWGAENWIRPAIKQALEYCDEAFLCVAPHSEKLKKFEDDTLKIATSFKGIKIISSPRISTHSQVKANILNIMSRESKYFNADNWLWILDVDEFYPKNSFKKIRELITQQGVDQIGVGAKLFLINMRYYLKSSHLRLFKIKNGEMNKFKPTQQWQGGKEVSLIPIEDGMFHYSLLTNPNLRREQWRTEYPGKSQANKTNWLDNIYLNYDLDNEEYWVNKNKELFGIKSPFFTDCFSPNESGKLFKYEGKHPEFIEETDLTKIKDFRKCGKVK